MLVEVDVQPERLSARVAAIAALLGEAPGDDAEAALDRVEAAVRALSAERAELVAQRRKQEAAVDVILEAIAALGSQDFEVMERLGDPEDEAFRAIFIGLRMMAEEIQFASGELARARDEALAARAGLLAANATLAERTAELDAANRSLEKAMRLKDEFLANMSHELRTPLNAILGFSEALREQVYGPVGPRQAATLERIEKSGRHLTSLIDDILDLARIGAGTIALEPEPFDLAGVCHEAVSLVQPVATSRGLTVSCDAAEALPLVGDRRRVLQIVLNLLSNAAKFTSAGAIGVRLRRAPGEAGVEVWDTGIGIAEEDIARLFQPFIQLEAGLARRFGGTGLGLALSARFAALLGGRIDVASKVGEGSRFTLWVPLQAPNAGISPSSETISSKSSKVSA